MYAALSVRSMAGGTRQLTTTHHPTVRSWTTRVGDCSAAVARGSKIDPFAVRVKDPVPPAGSLRRIRLDM
jgi:hypothetical protein